MVKTQSKKNMAKALKTKTTSKGKSIRTQKKNQDGKNNVKHAIKNAVSTVIEATGRKKEIRNKNTIIHDDSSTSISSGDNESDNEMQVTNNSRTFNESKQNEKDDTIALPSPQFTDETCEEESDRHTVRATKNINKEKGKGTKKNIRGNSDLSDSQHDTKLVNDSNDDSKKFRRPTRSCAMKASLATRKVLHEELQDNASSDEKSNCSHDEKELENDEDDSNAREHAKEKQLGAKKENNIEIGAKKLKKVNKATTRNEKNKKKGIVVATDNEISEKPVKSEKETTQGCNIEQNDDSNLSEKNISNPSDWRVEGAMDY